MACYCYLLLQLLEGSLVETVPSGRESNALSTLPSTTPGPSSHTDVTSGLINIVDDVDTVVDTVGEHQTSLQALLGTSSASSFMEDLNKWRNILQTIEAVLKLWMSVQDLWCLLREVSKFNALVVFLKVRMYNYACSLWSTVAFLLTLVVQRGANYIVSASSPHARTRMKSCHRASRQTTASNTSSWTLGAQ